MKQSIEIIPRTFKLNKSSSMVFICRGILPIWPPSFLAFPTALHGKVTGFFTFCLLSFLFPQLLLDNGGKVVIDKGRVSSSSFSLSAAWLRRSPGGTYLCFSAFFVLFVVVVLSVRAVIKLPSAKVPTLSSKIDSSCKSICASSCDSSCDSSCGSTS